MMKRDHQLSLRDSLNVFYLHVNLFRAVVIVLPLTVLVVCLAMTPIYESKARVLLTAKRQTSTLLQYPGEAGASMVYDLNVDEREINSEMEILTSPDLWMRTVKTLGLKFFTYPKMEEDHGLLAASVKKVKGLFGLSEPPKSAAEKERERTLKVVDYLLKNFKVVPGAKSKVLDVSLRYPDRLKARRILHELLSEYIPYHLEVYSLPGAEKFFAGQGHLYKKKLDEATLQLTQFRKKWGLSLPEKQKSELITLIERIRESLIDANANLAQYDRMLKALEKGHLASGQLAPGLERGGENTFLTVMASQMLQAEQKRWQATEMYSSGTRDSKMTAGILSELHKRFEDAVRVERSVAQSKKDSLEKGLQEMERKLEVLEEKSERARELQLDVTIAKDRYLRYVSKEEEARLENLKGGDKLIAVSIVGHPTFSIKPVSPKTFLFVLGALVLAFPLGIGVVLLANFFDHTFHDPAHLHAFSGYPVLTSLDKLSPSQLVPFHRRA